MSQVTEQSVRFQTALASIKLIQASAVLDLTEDDFDFLTSNKVWIATDRSRARRCVEACVYGTLDFVGRSEERFSRNAETDLVCRLLLEKKKKRPGLHRFGELYRMQALRRGCPCRPVVSPVLPLSKNLHR